MAGRATKKRARKASAGYRKRLYKKHPAARKARGGHSKGWRRFV